MKTRARFYRSLLAALGLAIFFGVFSVSGTNAQVLREVLNRMDLNYKGLSSLQSDVTLVKYNEQIGKSDTSVGNTSYLPKTAKRAMYVRIDWTKPVAESIVVIGEDYVMYRPTLNQVIKGKANSSKTAFPNGASLPEPRESLVTAMMFGFALASSSSVAANSSRLARPNFRPSFSAVALAAGVNMEGAGALMKLYRR